MKNRIRVLAALLALCLLAGLLTACGGGDDAAPLFAERGEVEREALGDLYPAADAGTVRSALAAAGQSAAARWEPEDAARAEAGPRLAVSGDASGDLTATDGSCIYMLDSYGLIIVSAAGAGSELLSYTRVDREGTGWSERLFLGENRAAVLWTVSDYGTDSAGTWHDDAEVRLTVFDTADRREPKLLSEIAVDGSLVDACLTEGTLCVVTQKTFLTLPGEKEAETVLPALRENGKTLKLEARDVYLCPDPAKAALTVAAAVRLEDGRVADALAFTDGAEAVLAAGKDLFLARTFWDETASEPYREEPYAVVEYSAAVKTEIKRLRLDGGLTLAGGCVLDGALSDPAALNAADGVLRIAAKADHRSFAAYTDEKHGWTNYEGRSRYTGSQLAILNENLEVLGTLTDLGGEAGITDCRFLNANAWITAGDTLAAADLSDRTAPAVCASFPAAGETLLLRDMGTDTVLGVTVPNAGGEWQLAMYDLSDPASPKRMADTEPKAPPAGDLTARGALFADGVTGLIGYPAVGEQGVEYRLVRWTGSKFQEKGALALEYVPADARGLLLDGLFYVCSPGAVYVADPETMTVLTTVSNAVG